MSLSIITRTTIDTLIVDLCGRLSYPCPELREKVQLLLGAGTRRLVINMSGVVYVDSYGLGQLVLIWTEIKNKGATMTIAEPSARIRQLLEITKLNTVFDISADGLEALK